MLISVREAATLLEKSPRAVRAQVARGDLRGVKRDGRWLIERRDLPLSSSQRRVLQRKANGVRRTVEEALPSRMAATAGQRNRSIADLDAFRRGVEVLAEIESDTSGALEDPVRQRVCESLEKALLALTEAVLQFDRDLKMVAVGRARGDLAHALGLLLLKAGIPPEEPVFQWVTELETEVIPAVAGFARWAEGLRGSRP